MSVWDDIQPEGSVWDDIAPGSGGSVWDDVAPDAGRPIGSPKPIGASGPKPERPGASAFDAFGTAAETIVPFAAGALAAATLPASTPLWLAGPLGAVVSGGVERGVRNELAGGDFFRQRLRDVAGDAVAGSAPVFGRGVAQMLGSTTARVGAGLVTGAGVGLASSAVRDGEAPKLSTAAGALSGAVGALTAGRAQVTPGTGAVDWDTLDPGTVALEPRSPQIGGKLRDAISSRVAGTMPGQLWRENLSSASRKLVNSGDPLAKEIAEDFARAANARNRFKALHASETARAVEGLSPDQANALLAQRRRILANGGNPNEVGAFADPVLDEANQRVAALWQGSGRAMQRAGVQLQTPDGEAIPFQPNPRYDAPRYAAKDYAGKNPFLAAIEAEQTRGGYGKSKLQEHARVAADPTEPMLEDFREVLDIKGSRDAYKYASALAFGGETVPMQIDGRQIAIGKDLSQKIDAMEALAGSDLADTARLTAAQWYSPYPKTKLTIGAQRLARRASQAQLGLSPLSNTNQATTALWFSGSKPYLEGLRTWRTDRDMQLAYGLGGAQSAGLAHEFDLSNMNPNSLAYKAMGAVEHELRGPFSAAGLVAARDLSVKLAGKQASGVPFSKADFALSSEFGKTPDELATAAGKFSPQQKADIAQNYVRLTQFTQDPGEVGRAFTHPYARVLGTAYKGFGQRQWRLVKDHVLDYMTSTDPELRAVGTQRFMRLVAYQGPAALATGTVRQLAGGRAPAFLTDPGSQEGVSQALDTYLSSSLGIGGDVARGAFDAASAAAEKDEPSRLLRGAVDTSMSLINSPVLNSIGGIARDMSSGDPGRTIAGAARLAPYADRFRNLAPFSGLIGSAAKSALPPEDRRKKSFSLGGLSLGGK